MGAPMQDQPSDVVLDFVLLVHYGSYGAFVLDVVSQDARFDEGGDEPEQSISMVNGDAEQLGVDMDRSGFYEIRMAYRPTKHWIDYYGCWEHDVDIYELEATEVKYERSIS